MHRTWPFISRNSDHHNADNCQVQRLNGFTGNACPDFLCVGAQKAGTSWVYQQLEPHPDFWMPPVKELHYLDTLNRARRFHPPRSRDECDVCFLESMKKLSDQSYIDLKNYGELFRHKGALLSGDVSPAYSA